MQKGRGQKKQTETPEPPKIKAVWKLPRKPHPTGKRCEIALKDIDKPNSWIHGRSGLVMFAVEFDNGVWYPELQPETVGVIFGKLCLFENEFLII